MSTKENDIILEQAYENAIEAGINEKQARKFAQKQIETYE